MAWLTSLPDDMQHGCDAPYCVVSQQVGGQHGLSYAGVCLHVVRLIHVLLLEMMLLREKTITILPPSEFYPHMTTQLHRGHHNVTFRQLLLYLRCLVSHETR